MLLSGPVPIRCDKALWHEPKGSQKLTLVSTQYTSTGQTQFQAGFNGKPTFLLTIGGSRSVQFTLERGQRIQTDFDDSNAKFEITLALDEGVEKTSLSVVDPFFFFVVLKLEEPRQPMQLELSAGVTYVRRSGAKETVPKSVPVDYPGLEIYDINKNLLEFTASV